MLSSVRGLLSMHRTDGLKHYWTGICLPPSSWFCLEAWVNVCYLMCIWSKSTGVLYSHVCPGRQWWRWDTRCVSTRGGKVKSGHRAGQIRWRVLKLPKDTWMYVWEEGGRELGGGHFLWDKISLKNHFHHIPNFSLSRFDRLQHIPFNWFLINIKGIYPHGYR